MGVMNDHIIKFLEVIRVRTTGFYESTVLSELLDGLEKPRGLIDIKLYVHASRPGDFSINLDWRNDHDQTERSELGINLSNRLKEFGMVDHAVWIEK